MFLVLSDREGAPLFSRRTCEGIAAINEPPMTRVLQCAAKWTPIIHRLSNESRTCEDHDNMARIYLPILLAVFMGCQGTPSETEMSDPDFGTMTYNGIDAWDCRVGFEFPHPKACYWAVHVWAPATGPSDSQRLRFRELKSRYSELWAAISHALVNVHPTLTSLDDLNNSTSECVAVHLGEHDEGTVEIVYTLGLPEEGGRGYFVPLEGWEVGTVVVAE